MPCSEITDSSSAGTTAVYAASRSGSLPALDAAAKQAVRQTDLELLIAARAVHSPHGFARRCREIVSTMPGHAAHRQLDLLTNEIMAGLGFGEGIEVFEADVRVPTLDDVADQGLED